MPSRGAYAEKSPVVVISGAPGIKERGKDALLHHKVRDFHTQQHIYDEITVATARSWMNRLQLSTKLIGCLMLSIAINVLAI